MSRFKDITGQKFGRLTVIILADCLLGKEARWSCLCDCGATTVSTGSSLRGWKSKSCGCVRNEKTIARNTTHGAYRTPEYNSWRSMLRRCYDPDSNRFARYGGRGIIVCPEWHTFDGFLKDMGKKPTPEHSIDRFPNVDGNYEPGNCRWATESQQQNNRTTNRLVTASGKTKTMSEWAVELGCKVATLWYRLDAGWSDEKTVSTSIRARRT